jgi:nitrite reductase/ring-hydroxylating ferredoxin subunit
VKIASALLSEHDFLTADIVRKRRSGQTGKANILVFRFNGHIHAYLNLCMHMQRPLNCQQDAIFDREEKRLRCSMHGFVFEPETGTCLSPVCEGRKLQLINLVEQDGFLSLQDKQAEIVAVYRRGKELL